MAKSPKECEEIAGHLEITLEDILDYLQEKEGVNPKPEMLFTQSIIEDLIKGEFDADNFYTLETEKHDYVLLLSEKAQEEFLEEYGEEEDESDEDDEE